MDVTFELYDGSSFSIEIGFFDTVLEIKEKVEKYQDISVAKQTLIFNGQVLEDERDVEYCELLQYSCIQLVVEPDSTTPSKGAPLLKPTSSKTLKIMVVTQCGTHIVPVEVNPQHNVGELRKELESLQEPLDFDLPSERYIFIHKQEEMNDDHSFRWHDVSNGDIIQIFLEKCVTSGSS